MIVKSDTTSITSQFEGLIQSSIKKDSGWFQELRQKNLQRFKQTGLPTLKDEEWKYTNIQPILQYQYKLSEIDNLEDSKDLDEYIAEDVICFVFINGHFSKKLSKLGNLPPGVKIVPLKEAINNNGVHIKQFLTQSDPAIESSLVALNKALAKEGVYISFDKKTICEQPIHLIHITNSLKEETIACVHHLISLEESSQATILETHVSFNDDSIYFSNPLTEIFIGENATLYYNKAQKESQKAFHIGTTRVWQERNSNFCSFAFTTSGAITRNNLDVYLKGEGANALLNGLYSPFGHQLVDNHTCVEHRVPNCTSNQLYKGILNESARAVFNGKIMVFPPAQGTNSYQLNKNLLLGKDCLIDTKPQLEIGADDVKCTHGATIGQLNEDEIFYLQSRCISKKDAIKMLAKGFVDDILGTIQNETIRSKLNRLTQDALEKI